MAAARYNQWHQGYYGDGSMLANAVGQMEAVAGDGERRNQAYKATGDELRVARHMVAYK